MFWKTSLVSQIDQIWGTYHVVSKLLSRLPSMRPWGTTDDKPLVRPCWSLKKSDHVAMLQMKITSWKFVLQWFDRDYDSEAVFKLRMELNLLSAFFFLSFCLVLQVWTLKRDRFRHWLFVQPQWWFQGLLGLSFCEGNVCDWDKISECTQTPMSGTVSFWCRGWLQHGLELCNVGSTNAQKLANGDQASISLVVFFSLEPNAREVVLFRPARTCIFLKVWPSKFAVL